MLVIIIQAVFYLCVRWYNLFIYFEQEMENFDNAASVYYSFKKNKK